MAYLAQGTPVDDAALIDRQRMNWGAIFAGWFIATGIAGLLYVAGLAMGFSAFDAYDADTTAKGIGIGTALWFVLTWSAALFLGGMFASWFDGNADETMGSMHGVAVWGVSITTTALWVALGFAHAMHGGAGMDHRPGGPARAMAGATGNDAMLVLHANVARTMERADGPRAASGPERGGADAVVAALIAGKTDTAKALMVAGADIGNEAADTAVAGWSPVIAEARAKARQDADNFAHRTAMVLWIAFASGFLALIFAALGGWFGGARIHRVYHLRRYENRPFRDPTPRA
ncbi:MAG TPA: hypothetical protein VGO76_19110 [Luteibacter sp.]|nr:hypothetical protein [Luteibacter sp.]